MVLTYWDIAMTNEEVSKSCPTIGAEGTRAKDLRDFARAQGLKSYLIHGCWEDLVREIGLTHPVMVGLVKSNRNGAVTHWESAGFLTLVFSRSDSRDSAQTEP